MKNEWENESKEGMRLSHVFLIVLAIHMLVIGGAFAFQYWQGGSEASVSETTPQSFKKKPLSETPLSSKKVEVAKKAVESMPDSAALVSSKPVMPSEVITEPVEQKPVISSQPVFYKVSQGDTLSKIAKKNKVTVADLVKWNELKGDVIHLGQVLKVVIVQKESTGKTSLNELPPSSAIAAKSSVSRHEVVRETIVTPSSQRIENYVVGKGDTLFGIAKKFGTTPESILAANQLKDANKIGIGMKLKVPVETELSKVQSPKPAIEASNVAMSDHKNR